MTDGPDLFPGFRSRVIETPGARIRVRVGGSGPLVVLLHGYPQTGAMWHRIAAGLATRHTVAGPDLRGYGASECLDDDFSFRARAADVAALIDAVEASTHLQLAGFMTVGLNSPIEADVRAAYAQLRGIRDEAASRLGVKESDLALSMGMSRDLEWAIAEGATIVRLGTAIFGTRRV